MPIIAKSLSDQSSTKIGLLRVEMLVTENTVQIQQLHYEKLDDSPISNNVHSLLMKEELGYFTQFCIFLLAPFGLEEKVLDFLGYQKEKELFQLEENSLYCSP